MSADLEASKDALLIAVIGPTGVGKTTFVNTASSSNFVVGHSLESCTAEVQLSQPFTLDGKPVILFDTPGFDDTTRSETETLELISAFLAALHMGGKKLSGIIFLHRITDDRMGGVATKNFRLFRRLCGEKSLRNVIVATNRWTTVSEEVGERRQRQLGTDERFFKPAIDKGARLVKHTDTRESAHAIIRQVLHLPPVVPRVAEELVDEHKNIFETDAGKELNSELEQQVMRHKEEMKALQEEIRGLKRGFSEEREELRREYEKEREKLESAQKDREKLIHAQFSDRIGEMQQMIESMRGSQKELQEALEREQRLRMETQEKSDDNVLPGLFNFLGHIAMGLLARPPLRF